MMKKTRRQLASLVASMALVGAGALPQPAPADMSGSAAADAARKSLVLEFYKEFDAGRLQDFVAVSPEFSAEVMGNQVLDWGGFLAFGGAFLQAFPDGRHVFDHVLVDGDYVITFGTYRGTHRGELMGIAPTGREVALRVMHMDRVKDGVIVEHLGIGNAMDLMRQLGVAFQ